MSQPASAPASVPDDRTLISSRWFAAPRELVWQAYLRPEHLARWWGPKDFTNTFEEFDPRPGGTWRFVMHGPQGADYANHSVFTEITPPARFAFRHVCAPVFEMTADLAEESGGTRVTWRAVFETAKVCAAVKTYAVEANEQNFDRLAEQLQVMGGGVPPFILRRTFPVTTERLWRSLTRIEELGWWGPKGVTIFNPRLDLRPGGSLHYGMRTGDGHEMWGKWNIFEVSSPNRLVYLNSFSDPDGGTTRHPMSADWPLEILTTLTFTAAAGGGSELGIHWVPWNASPSECAVFAQSHDSMRQGWGGSLDRLEAQLRSNAQA